MSYFLLPSPQRQQKLYLTLRTLRARAKRAVKQYEKYVIKLTNQCTKVANWHVFYATLGLILRLKVLPAGECLIRWIGYIFLEHQVKEEKQRFGLENKDPRGTGLFIVKMLVNAGVSYDDRISGCPIQSVPVMNLVAFPLHDVENRTVHMAVFLTMGPGRKHIDMTFNRLENPGFLGIDRMLDKKIRAALEGLGFAFIDPGLLVKLLQQLSIFAGQLPDKYSFFVPAFPLDLGLLLRIHCSPFSLLAII